MNKFKSISLALAMAISLAACGNQAANEPSKEEPKAETKTEGAAKEAKDLSAISGTYEGSAQGYGGDINRKIPLLHRTIRRNAVQ